MVFGSLLAEIWTKLLWDLEIIVSPISQSINMYSSLLERYEMKNDKRVLMSSDKYQAVFIADSWKQISSNKYHVIFIADSWKQMSSDKYHLVFIAGHQNLFVLLRTFPTSHYTWFLVHCWLRYRQNYYGTLKLLFHPYLSQ